MLLTNIPKAVATINFFQSVFVIQLLDRLVNSRQQSDICRKNPHSIIPWGKWFPGKVQSGVVFGIVKRNRQIQQHRFDAVCL